MKTEEFMYLPEKEKVFTAFGSKRSDRLFSNENNILGNEIKRIFFIITLSMLLLTSVTSGK